jgi:hypothetical protein
MFLMLTRLILCLCTLFILASSQAAAAENRRKAIAFSYAPEMSMGQCVGRDVASAMACAKKKCIAEGGTKEDCLDVAACFPANWTVVVAIQPSDGPSWTEFHCGWANRELALKAAEAACDREIRGDVMECGAALLYDENGREYEP